MISTLLNKSQHLRYNLDLSIRDYPDLQRIIKLLESLWQHHNVKIGKVSVRLMPMLYINSMRRD